MKTYLEFMSTETVLKCQTLLNKMIFINFIKNRTRPTALKPITPYEGAPNFRPLSVPLYPFVWPSSAEGIPTCRIAVVRGTVLDPRKMFYAFKRIGNFCYLGTITDFEICTRNQWRSKKHKYEQEQHANYDAVKEYEQTMKETGVDWKNCDNWNE